MSTAPPSPRHVLVADDDRVTREYVAGLLRGNGYEVTTVDNGKKAIEGALKVTSTSATLKAEAITIAATGSATISGGKVLTISADLVKIN